MPKKYSNKEIAENFEHLLSKGWSFSNSDSFKEEKERRRSVDWKTDRILEIGGTKDRAEARRRAKAEVFEEEFFRSSRP